MKRYLNSFFITSFIYLILAIIFFSVISEISLETKKEEEKSITTISLNSVAVQKVEEVTKEIEKEIVPEPIVEKIIEKPAQKVIEKPKKVEKKIVKQEKQIEKVVEKTPEKIVEQATENIEKMHVAEQNETSQKQQSSIQENSNNQSQNLENEYLAKVKNKIEKNKVYPKVAKRLNQTGKVIVSFDILKDGKVTNIKIINKSKFEKLDEASIELLTNIGFFEAIPNELNKTVWNIQIPINYQIN